MRHKIRNDNCDIEIGKTYIDTGDSYIPTIRWTVLDIWYHNEMYISFTTSAFKENVVVSVSDNWYRLKDWIKVI